MTAATLEFVDPDMVTIEAQGGTWFATGLEANGIRDLARSPVTPAAGVDAVTRHRGATVGLVRHAGQRLDAVYLWRGLLSLGGLYYAVTGGGDVVVSDHPRNVASRIPVSSRPPTDRALIEHYLTGFAYDRVAFCGGMEAVASGDEVRIDSSGSVDVRIVDRVATTSVPGAVDDVVERVEAALDDANGRIGSGQDVCVTFSGGVDSTLLASFYREPSSLVTMTTDSPEFALETDYAYAAAELLGRTVTEVFVGESSYVELLEASIDRMATPPAHYVIPMLMPLYDRPETTFVLGEGADSVFGTDRGLRRISGALANRAGLGMLGAVSGLPDPVGFRARQLRSYASGYARPFDDPRGTAGAALAYGDSGQLDAMVGRDVVDEVMTEHLEHVTDRVDLETPSRQRFHRHNEIVRWRHTMGSMGTIDRLLGHPVGKRVEQPFTDAEVIEALLTVPASRRYVKRLAGKWVLKDMLARRVAGYPVNQRKNATGIPFLRYCVDGPLVDIWDRYDVPDFIPASERRAVMEHPSPVTWHALTHAIWMDRIGANRDLMPHPARVRIDVGEGAG